MIDENIQKPTLIYFRVRGHAQVLRSVMLELEIDFDEILITDDGYLDPTLIHNYGIEMKNLPYLLHNGTAIHQLYPILKCICLIAGQANLLGKNVEDQIKVFEILTKFTKEKNTILSVLKRGLAQIKQRGLGDEAFDKLSQILIQIFDQNRNWKIAQKLSRNSNQYILGYLSVLDFIFYQKCFYYANMRTANIEPQGSMVKNYVAFFQSSSFYAKNKDALEKYKIFIDMNDEMTQTFSKIWIGENKFIFKNE